jgi:hypothetical protein
MEKNVNQHSSAASKTKDFMYWFNALLFGGQLR